ncbi:response regulator [Dermatophilus congolensis]|uniref:response regulator n=1 Tax=Dermatophilus congolensis TaxID=1863 RepID=UPI001AAE467B|nr:response regulator transcription factor [Dermatophilus congolensis]MBO3142460.1 response regulator transcription factor [Dermatophilus congolensis]MBO3151449.1 response regulator transcription factor [Dermatophilus congolensis]MBO3161547.1 response regulator transcription factor [Dermatophilus congolensis]MBO3162735.1 response regulator transcription factor [Dermatophilus congolensis]MBO3176289.1 response regulator transcription factor [Dermatophilus congolensis]
MTVIKVGLVDDQELFTSGLALILDSQEDLEVCWRARNGREALDCQAAVRADVTLMDVRMPVMNGIQAIKQWFGGRVIVLTTFDDEDYLTEALAHGASGFLVKDSAPRDILAAVRTVHAGDAVISPRSTRQLLARVQPALRSSAGVTEAAQRVGLTAREVEVLTLVASGLSNAEIAEKLWISLPTVKTHVSQVFHKTGSRDRVQAVLWACAHGLIDPRQALRGPGRNG